MPGCLRHGKPFDDRSDDCLWRQEHKVQFYKSDRIASQKIPENDIGIISQLNYSDEEILKKSRLRRTFSL